MHERSAESQTTVALMGSDALTCGGCLSSPIVRRCARLSMAKEQEWRDMTVMGGGQP